MSSKQQEHESLVNYIKRFNKESLKISDLQDGVAFTSLMSGLWLEKFIWSLAENEETAFIEAMPQAQKLYPSVRHLQTSIREAEKEKRR